MKQSLKLLCQGRRVFLGKNLFSKGACFAAMRLSDKRPPQYVYIGEHEVKCNVSLKVYERGNLSFYTLISAGEPWFEVQGGCELVIDGSPTVDFWIQQPNSREARIESVPKSDHEVQMTLTDVGMGELVPGTGKKWEYLLTL